MKAKDLLLGRRNQITLPREFIPDGVTFFRGERNEDGSIVLMPQISVPAHQAYFWTPRWQEGEKKASEDIQTGRLHRYPSSGKLVARLNRKRKQGK